MAKKNTKKKNKKAPLAWQKSPFLSDTALFDDSEGTFIDNNQRRRVYVHLVPAPWSRVIILSLVYALGVTFVKIAWFHFYGKPQWFALSAESAVEADFQRQDSKLPDLLK